MQSTNIAIKKTELRILQTLIVLLFLGRAYQAFFWDLPIRALLWSEKLMSGPVKILFGMDWHSYATHPNNDYYMQLINKGFGSFWILCAIAAVSINNYQKFSRYILYAGSGSLFLLAILFSLDKFALWGEFLEYSLQIMAPILLVIISKKNDISIKWLFLIQFAVALTFFSHGLYAFGIYPQPGAWVQWCMNMFFMSEELSKSFLKLMGVIDFIAALYLLLPLQRFQKTALWYCVIWGTMTALARLTSNFYWEFLESFFSRSYSWVCFHQKLICSL
jgi:hypothetical protein